MSMTYTEMFTQLVRAEIELWNSLDRSLLADAGISLPTYQSLSAIAAGAGSARVQDVSDTMLITVGATSKLVDRLERDGLVSRQANPDDRRSSLVRLTDRGVAVLESAGPLAEKHLASILAPRITESRASELADELLSLRGVAS